MSQIMTRAYRYLIEAGAFNVPNPVMAKANAMRRLMDEGVRADIAESAIRNAFNDTMLANKPITPAIDWKPINKEEMLKGKAYLLWGEGFEHPEVGRIVSTGILYSVFPDQYGDSYAFEYDELTHYAEFNKPEGVE